MTQQEEGMIKAEVNAAFQELIEASNALDFDRYLALFDTTRFSGLHTDGTVMHSIEDLVSTYKPGFAMVDAIEHLAFQNVKITVIDSNTAILVNEYTERSRLKTGTITEGKGGGTQVWSRQTGAWKLVSISSSPGT